MIKYGLKLWTDNQKQFKDAVKLCNQKQIDFIELYYVPNSFNANALGILKNTRISIHAPHDLHNFDIFKLNEQKINLFKNQVIKISNFFNSKHIILHAGTGDNLEVFRKSIAKIYDKRIIIENMPKISLDNEICFGYSLKQLQFIKNECKLNICLDFAHAIKGAKSQNLNYKDYLGSLISNLNPNYFHITGSTIDDEQDEHLDLEKGNFDLKWIKKVLIDLSFKKDIYLVFETPKYKNGLKNDLKNMNYFKNL